MQADRRPAIAQPRQLAVLRTEVVAPLADAVRFVDRDETDRPRRQHGEEAVAAVADQPLGRHVQQSIACRRGRRARPRSSAPTAASCCSRPRARRCRRACRPDPSSARSAARRRWPGRRWRRPAPGSRATCRRRSAAPAASRGRTAPPPSLPAATDGRSDSPSTFSRMREDQTSDDDFGFRIEWISDQLSIADCRSEIRSIRDPRSSSGRRSGHDPERCRSCP